MRFSYFLSYTDEWKQLLWSVHEYCSTGSKVRHLRHHRCDQANIFRLVYNIQTYGGRCEKLKIKFIAFS